MPGGAFLWRNLSLSNVTHSGRSDSFQIFPFIMTEASGWFATNTRGICLGCGDCCCGQKGKIVVVLIGFVCCDLSTKLWTVDIIVSNALFAGSEIPERSASYVGTSGDVASRVNS